ncbi:MAG: thiamine phosphate synthase [Vicinamibacterales bacterium]
MKRSRPLEAHILYAIIDRDVCAARQIDAADAASACIAAGVPLLQLRQKSGSSGALFALAAVVVRRAEGTPTQVIVNDRADLARAAGAQGVHLGQDDLGPADVRAILGPDAIVGVSTHTREQIDRALDSAASYVAVGPVFATATKDTGYDARGLDLVRYAAGRGKPVVAIGGITLSRAPEVIAAGASAVAVITDLLVERDLEQRVRAFAHALPPQVFKV